MDAIERVARVLAELEDGQPWPDISEFGEQFRHLERDAHRTAMREDAALLIERFPVLALEPSDEWGFQQEGEIAAPMSSKERAAEALSNALTELDDEGNPYADRLVRRKVWTGEWEGVEAR